MATRRKKITTLVIFLIFAMAIAGVITVVKFRKASKQPDNPALSLPEQGYMALGDSIAAGVGLKTYSDSSACNRTNESYASKLAVQHNYKLTSLACSGATMASGILGSQDVNRLPVKPQVEQLFAAVRPAKVTITIGANDIGWSQFISKCYTAVCGEPADTALVDTKLRSLASDIKIVLTRISAHYGPKVPAVTMTGYHQVFPPRFQNCLELTGVDAGELTWFRAQLTRLNATVEDSIKTYPFARFAPIDFSGHELCSPDSWVQDAAAKAPFHPNEAGQTAYARAVQ